MSVLSISRLISALAVGLILTPVMGLSQAYTPFSGAVDPLTLTKDHVGSEVAIEGALTRFTPSRAANVPNFLLFGEDPTSGFTLVVFPRDAERVLGGTTTIAPGTKVSATGTVAEYRGNLQIVINDPTKLRIDQPRAAAAPAQQTRSASSAPTTTTNPAAAAPAAGAGYVGIEVVPRLGEMMGQEIAFSGTISGFRPSWSERAPNVVTVGTEAANFDIVYWKRDAPPLLFDKIGSTIYAKGVVGEHNDRKQLRVNDLSMISYEPLQIAAPAAGRARPTGDAAAAWRSGGGPAYTPPKVDTSGVLSPADILRTHEGKTVTTEGTVFAVREANDGVAIIVRDNRGQRIARLAPGQATPPKDAAVRVEGQVVWNDARSSPELVNARVSAR